MRASPEVVVSVVHALPCHLVQRPLPWLLLYQQWTSGQAVLVVLVLQVLRRVQVLLVLQVPPVVHPVWSVLHEWH